MLVPVVGFSDAPVLALLVGAPADATGFATDVAAADGVGGVFDFPPAVFAGEGKLDGFEDGLGVGVEVGFEDANFLAETI